jgi:poly-gamma-glutamate capsule biosynthesis protein CapA/YwtB (metallophosphatase superfamily)
MVIPAKAGTGTPPSAKPIYLAVRDKLDVASAATVADESTNTPDEEDFNLIRQSDAKVDVLLVGVHWGAEYRKEPAEIQRRWAKRMVEDGVDVIVGHGPHWVQERQEFLGRPVYYSLGNFVFDQMWSEETKSGLAVRFIFKGKKVVAEEELPVFMRYWAQPKFVKN